MHMIIFVIIAFACIASLYCFLFFMRMFRVHHGSGTFVLVRKHGSDRWHHARFFYSSHALRYITHTWRLSSVFFRRVDIRLIPSEDVTQLAASMHNCRDGLWHLKTHSDFLDIILDSDSITALQAWIESSPSRRQVPCIGLTHKTKSPRNTKHII